ncbi:MAG: class I SAM-dependent RNA methyltransferase, partial [Lachnospiraceae bacterium]|nr:class I SAM-dependent RNA methyltransferase [Lachnospiraceae bacterium]
MAKNDQAGSYKKNDIVRLEITDMSTEGMGVGKADGYTLFVKDAITGDVIDARITKAGKSYGYGRLESIISPSPDRTEPECPYARQCGGCQLQAMSYDAQIKYKTGKVRNDLIRIGGFDPELIDAIMEPVIGMEDPWRYRNKAQYPVGTDRNGDPVAGFYAGRTHNIISNTDCMLGIPENREILEIILDHMKKYNIPAYDDGITLNSRTSANNRNRYGKRKIRGMKSGNIKEAGVMIRHILIRKGFHTGEIMVCLVILCNNMDKSCPKNEAAEETELMESSGGEYKTGSRMAVYINGQNELIERLVRIEGIRSISVNINNKNTNVIMGKETHTLWGSDRISDVLLGKKFEISPLSFY